MNKSCITLKETATYSIGSLGREISNNCISVFFLAYLNVIIGLDALVLTVAFVIAKLWDAVNDPMLATLINNTKSGRFGRFRPWIAIGMTVNAIVLVGMFAPVNFSLAGKYAYYILMYMLWGMSFTLIDVPFWSMIPTIADSTNDRNKISSMARLIGGFGGFVISTLGTALILPLASPKVGSNNAYLLLGGATALAMIIFLMFTLVGNKERYVLPNENANLKEIFVIFKKNDQLRAYAMSYVLYVIATLVSLFQILYLFIYYGEAGLGLLSQSHYGLFTAVACTGQGIAMFFYSQMTKKIPREKIYGANYFMAIIGMLGMFFVFFLLGNNTMINVILVALAGTFLMTSNGLNQIGSTVMMADIIDYGEWKYGKRSDSIMFSVQTLLAKFAGAFAMLILGIGIKVAQLPSITEYLDPITGQYIQTFVDGTGAVSIEALNILRIFMFLVPIPLCLLGYIFYKKKYNLYGKKFEIMKSELLAKRDAASISKEDK